MKKSTWIKLAAVGVQAVPPVVVLLVNAPVFVERTDKAISAAAILVAVILALIFKDATKKIFQTPSAFKTCLFCFLFSLIAVSLGSQMLQISATALISGACAIPLNMWYNNETKPATTDDIVDALKGFVKENKDESNDKNS
jgi:hypothetical protein